MEAYLSRGKKFIGDSIILKFPYDADLVNYIKNLPIRSYDPETKTWEIPLEQFPRFVDYYKKPIILHISFASIKQEKEIEIPKDYKFPFNPYPHQLEGIKFGLNRDSFLLSDGMGMGKTLQSATIACIKKKLYDYKHCLIICAVNGSKYNWKKECEQFTDEKAHILGTRITTTDKEVIKSNKEKLEDLKNIDNLPFFIITNKETLRDKAIVKELEKQSKKIDMCIYDEIHMCLSGDSIIQTDIGPKKIQDIVNNKLFCKVLSRDKDGCISYKKILDYHKYVNYNNLIKLTFTINDKVYTLRCTADHKIFTYNRGYVKASDLTIQDEVEIFDGNYL